MPNLTPKQWTWAISVSIVGVGGLNLGLFSGLAQTDANNGGFDYGTKPISNIFTW